MAPECMLPALSGCAEWAWVSEFNPWPLCSSRGPGAARCPPLRAPGSPLSGSRRHELSWPHPSTPRAPAPDGDTEGVSMRTDCWSVPVRSFPCPGWWWLHSAASPWARDLQTAALDAPRGQSHSSLASLTSLSLLQVWLCPTLPPPHRDCPIPSLCSQILCLNVMSPFPLLWLPMT